MKSLREIFGTLKPKSSVKWEHYFDIYEANLSKFVNKPIKLLEIGVDGGGSLKMWKEYFPKASIYGLDISPSCIEHNEDRIEVFIGDQENESTLNSMMQKIGNLDVIIDDGGHMPNQQINSFKVLWPSLTPGGMYLIEDLHSSYFASYSGGYKKEGTCIEYLKSVIDTLNFSFWDSNLKGTDIASITFYDSVAILTKISKPYEKVKVLWSGS